jgi:hypothetical protein
MEPSQLSIEDFSGGLTDYELDAEQNQSAALNNLLINPNRKIQSAPGSVIYAANMYQVPDGNVRVCGLFSVRAYNDFFISSGEKVWRPNVTSFAELIGPTSNPAFDTATTANFNSFAEWNEHVYITTDKILPPVKVYKDGSSVYQLRTAGLPALGTVPTTTSSGGTGSNYVYAYIYAYSYTVGTAVFQDYGPVTYVPKNNIGAPNVNIVNITAIPVLANGATLNYDTTNITVEIYRTTNNGFVFYKVGQVTNGTTTFNDNMSDATLQNQLLLYTTGDILENDPPPPSKYVTVVNGIAYYGHVKEGNEVLKNRVRQSIQDDPDSCPAELFIDVIDEIVGLSSYNDNPLVFTQGHVFRLNGQFNELGQGSVSYEDITKTIGCASHNSIVQTRFGVFWAGDDGFYWTDGFNYRKISDSINESYKLIVGSATKKSRIYGTFDKKDNRVIWAVSFDNGATDNDYFFTLDLRWGIRDASTFTTRNNGTSFSPTAICFYDGQLIRGDRRGYILKHDAQYLTDPKIDTTTTPNLWTTAAIRWTYATPSLNFGAPQARKWVPRLLLSLGNESNVSVQIESKNDNASLNRDLKLIRYRGNVVWGDPFPIWGQDSPIWGFVTLIEEMRRFPARGLRCSFKQIILTQAFTNIYNSDSYCTATVSNALNTATLTDVTFSWPTDLVDYFISFEDDEYVKEYLISARNSATAITFVDSGNTAPDGVQKWVIKGYPKGEVFSLLSLVLYYSIIGNNSYPTWRTEQNSTGGNS